MTVNAAAALLGACLIDPECVGGVARVVHPEDFPTPQGRMVYEAILAVHERCGTSDFVLVADELERRGTLAKVGTGNLTALVNRCPSSLHALHYARLVALNAEARNPTASQELPAGALVW